MVNYSEPTARQLEVLQFIRDFQSSRLRSPFRGEIAVHFGWNNASSAQVHIRALVKKGMLEMDESGTILFPRKS